MAEEDKSVSDFRKSVEEVVTKELKKLKEKKLKEKKEEDGKKEI